jgi:hypothetical protein
LEILIGLLALALLLCVAGAWYQRVGAIRDARRFPPPGRLIDVGGTRLHIHIQGDASPPVVFEAGIAATSLSWQLVQPEIARLAQTASCDRAGLGEARCSHASVSRAWPSICSPAAPDSCRSLSRVRLVGPEPD